MIAWLKWLVRGLQWKVELHTAISEHSAQLYELQQQVITANRRIAEMHDLEARINGLRTDFRVLNGALQQIKTLTEISEICRQRVDALEQINRIQERVEQSKRVRPRNWSEFRTMAEQAEGVENAS